MESGHPLFQDTQIAFASQTDHDLKRAYWLFRIIGLNWMVKISPPLVNVAMSLRLPLKGVIKKTIFRHFCGGENIRECSQTIERLGKFNIGTILDYSVEGKDSEADLDHTLNEIISTIRRAKGDKNVPFCVFKPTGICRFGLLEKKNARLDLSPEETDEYSRFIYRFNQICSEAEKNDVPVFIDAEESWIQDAIDEVALNMMMKFNKRRAILYNTVQLYRLDRLNYLKELSDHALESDFMVGVKLVRGAYMEKERKRATQLGLLSPIQPDKASSDRDYNDALIHCIKHIEKVAICAGTHNEESSAMLAELMKKNNIRSNHPHIWFSQLYGMSDHISFNLAKAGYNVCKYVPYGPVEAVLPYLIRRAQENTSVKGQTGRELSLILKEIRRRKN
ncbi:MAG: proline dehydrogenase family protein [Bacteroidota bacterium]